MRVTQRWRGRGFNNLDTKKKGGRVLMNGRSLSLSAISQINFGTTGTGGQNDEDEGRPWFEKRWLAYISRDYDGNL